MRPTFGSNTTSGGARKAWSTRRSDASEPAAIRASGAVDEGGFPEAPPLKKRILMIEDDCDHADALIALLELEGYAAECAPDGASGMQRVREAPPDLVLLDFTLPDMSGADVGRTIRSAA